MAFFMSYSDYIWRNRGRNVEAVHVGWLIYMIKKLSLICGGCLEFRVLFASSKIFDHVNWFIAFWL